MDAATSPQWFWHQLLRIVSSAPYRPAAPILNGYGMSTLNPPLVTAFWEVIGVEAASAEAIARAMAFYRSRQKPIHLQVEVKGIWSTACSCSMA